MRNGRSDRHTRPHSRLDSKPRPRIWDMWYINGGRSDSLVFAYYTPSVPCANQFEPGRFRGCDAPGALQIAALTHRLFASGIDGLPLAGTNFVYRPGSTFGVRVDDADPLLNDETIVRLEGGAHLSDSEILTDIRRFRTPHGHPLGLYSPGGGSFPRFRIPQGLFVSGSHPLDNGFIPPSRRTGVPNLGDDGRIPHRAVDSTPS